LCTQRWVIDICVKSVVMSSSSNYVSRAGNDNEKTVIGIQYENIYSLSVNVLVTLLEVQWGHKSTELG
jgi:hypothetical protein